MSLYYLILLALHKKHYPPGNHMLTTGADDPTLYNLVITLAGARAIIKVSSHQHRWLASGYDLEIGHF